MIVPAFNAAPFLRKSLPQLLEFAPETPILVVDAGSTDETAEVARSLGIEVLQLPQREGPARARNLGAEAIEAEVLLFIDSDCVVHADVIERVEAAFAAEPELVALSGSYDATPPEPNFFSQYMNLRHHFTHQHATREPATFWAGCGAVRRKPFLEVGGFDALRYPRPTIEDIELGTRLRAVGRVRLDPDLNVKHLKHWTLQSVVDTDIRCRALPWARLVAETQELPNDLNMRASQRIAALIAPLALLAIAAVPVAFSSGHFVWAALGVAALATSWFLNAPMLSFFARVRGPRFALGAWLFHQVHLFYAASIFAGTLVIGRLRSLFPGTARS